MIEIISNLDLNEFWIMESFLGTEKPWWFRLGPYVGINRQDIAPCIKAHFESAKTRRITEEESIRSGAIKDYIQRKQSGSRIVWVAQESEGLSIEPVDCNLGMSVGDPILVLFPFDEGAILNGVMDALKRTPIRHL